MTDEFYITISSEQKGLHGAKNTASNFNVHLPHEIFLNGKWEVGVAEIYYPLTISPYEAKDFEMHFGTNGAAVPATHYVQCTKDDEIVTTNVPLETSFDDDNITCFRDYAMFIKMIKSILLGHGIVATEHKEHLAMHASPEKSPIQVQFTKKMSKILGMNRQTVLLKNTLTVISSRRIDIFRGLPMFLTICTNLIQPQQFCGTYIPVISTFPLKQNSYVYGFNGYHTFHNCMKYHRVNQNRIDDIEMHITNPDGNLTSFDSGTCTVTLHFKRVSA